MLNCRSNRGKRCRYVACSRDGGETWFEEFDDPTLPEPRCQASILGKVPPTAKGAKPRLVFVNPAGGSDRTNLTVRVSTDDGKTWSPGRTIQPGPAAYSSIAFLKDGTMGVLYETGKVHPYEKVVFARFNLEWLTGR
jgi:sialidase-1